MNQAAEPLPNDNQSYVTAKMETQRYGHQALLLNTGRVLVVGGTDERHYTSLDTAEIYDQSLKVDGSNIPESVTGVWVTTDFQGDQIIMKNGPRVFHSLTEIAGGNALVAGGSADILLAGGYFNAELFDVQSRIFDPDDLKIANEQSLPLFRHVAHRLPSGAILFIGGQYGAEITIVIESDFQGVPPSVIEVVVFPSTEQFEIFDPASRTFSIVQDAVGNETQLQTARGRAAHAAVTVAGIDNKLNTSDDIVVIAGGTMTLSNQFAPTNKFVGSFSANAQTTIEYFDNTTRVNSSAPNLVVSKRSNGTKFLNLGQYVGVTPDGIKGVNNVALLTHGDDDETTQTSVALSELVVTTFSGFGPANGITFFKSASTNLVMGLEYNTYPLLPPCATYGRSYSDALMMRCQRTYADVTQNSNWAITIGGAHLFVTPAGQGQNLNGFCGRLQVRGVELFDPFYNILNVTILDPLTNAPVPPWDLTTTRSLQNPTGVAGSWIAAHLPAAQIPSNSYLGYGYLVGFGIPSEFPPLPFVAAPQRSRIYHTLTQVAGVDGSLNTYDDRILIVGGGDSYSPDTGGEAVPQNEVYLPPGANSAP